MTACWRHRDRARHGGNAAANGSLLSEPNPLLKETPMALTNQRVDVPVIVDESKCLEKCVACIEVCPLDVLVKNPETGKAYMKYDECWFCLPCEKECPTNAITVQIPFLLR